MALTLSDYAFRALEGNLFSGPVPSDLGKLINMERLSVCFSFISKFLLFLFLIIFKFYIVNFKQVKMIIDNGLVLSTGNYSYLRANNLTGELPVALTNLTKLKEL